MTSKAYGNMIRQLQPRSHIGRDCAGAFVIGGLICVLGQGLLNLYLHAGLAEADAYGAASMTLVALSALFTGLSLYDNLAQYAGAGTLVPITGFSNAVSAAAIEYRTEGYIFGVGARMFTIAGPVIVYGTAASVIYGLIYWLMGL